MVGLMVAVPQKLGTVTILACGLLITNMLRTGLVTVSHGLIMVKLKPYDPVLLNTNFGLMLVESVPSVKLQLPVAGVQIEPLKTTRQR